MYHAKNGNVKISSGDLDYVRFGTGGRVLVILPGLGDGLRTVRGTALPMAWMYRSFAGDFTVYMFSRRNNLSRGCTTRDMARDLAEAMEVLGIRRADVLGVSMGGMIAQWLAIDHGDRVNRLILAVTSAGPNPILTESVEEWSRLARQDDHTALMDSNVRRIYSHAYYRKSRWMIPLMGKLTKPKSYNRFLIQAEACLTHDALADLPRIQAPTLVIGGNRDQCLGGDASRELAARIPGARLRMYGQWGHGLYEEAPDFNAVVRAFCLEEDAQ